VLVREPRARGLEGLEVRSGRLVVEISGDSLRAINLGLWTSSTGIEHRFSY
jgi:hypothetical protein